MFKKIGLVAVLCAAFLGSALANDISNEVELTELRFANAPNGTNIITGTATNITNHEIKKARIWFDLLENGQIIGQIFDEATNIKPGQSWEISAFYNGIITKPDSFKATVISDE